MKTLPLEAVDQLEGRRPIIAASFKAVLPSETYPLWSGYGDLDIEEETYQGIGARALITRHESRIGGAADGLTISLSGLDPDIAQTIEEEDYHGAPITIRRLVFAPDGETPLGSAVFMRGRIDTVIIREKVGGEAALDFQIEGPRADMGRSGARIASDSDQRVLGGSGDASCKHISVAGRKTLQWGQSSAVAGPVLSGPMPVPGFMGVFGLFSRRR